MVMGATNRPEDVDKAILRRMIATFHVGLPVSNMCCTPQPLRESLISLEINKKKTNSFCFEHLDKEHFKSHLNRCNNAVPTSFHW